MEVVEVAGSISGTEVVNDLLDRVAEKLMRFDCLRSTDSYQSYSARVTVELQLTDFDTSTVSTGIEVGTIDPAQPSTLAAISLPTVAAAEVRAGLEPAPNLERPIIDSDAAAGAPEAAEAQAPQPRQYISRIRGHGTK
jgi:hypothetical protein